VNTIKLQEWPCYVGLGYVRREIGECSKTISDQSMTDDGSTSSHSSDNEDSMGTYQRHTRSTCSKMIQKVWRRKNHCGDYNEDGHRRATCQILHAQESPMKEKAGKNVKKANLPQGNDPFILMSKRWFYYI